mgnify:CR=1 FL=1
MCVLNFILGILTTERLAAGAHDDAAVGAALVAHDIFSRGTGEGHHLVPVAVPEVQCCVVNLKLCNQIYEFLFIFCKMYTCIH